MGGREPLAVRAAASPVLARIATASAVGGLPLARSVDNGRSSPGTGRTPRARCRAGDARTRVLRHRPRSQPGQAGGKPVPTAPAPAWPAAACCRVDTRRSASQPAGPARAPFGPRCAWRRLRRRQCPPTAGCAGGSPDPSGQLSVGASRAVSTRPDQDPSALRALRCGSSLGPVVPRRHSRPLSGAPCRTSRRNG